MRSLRLGSACHNPPSPLPLPFRNNRGKSSLDPLPSRIPPTGRHLRSDHCIRFSPRPGKIAGVKAPTPTGQLLSSPVVPAGRTGPRLVLPFPATLVSQWLRIPEIACAFVLRGTARWLQTTAAVGARPSSDGIHCGPLTRKRPQLGLYWAFGPGRASHSGLSQLPFQVGRMLVLKVCVTKTSKW